MVTPHFGSGEMSLRFPPPLFSLSSIFLPRAGPVGVEPRWIPPKNRAEALAGYSRAWEGFLAGMEVVTEAEGQDIPGPNYRFLGE